MKLSLKLKFNLVFVAIFGVGLLVSAWLAQALLYRSAREETLQDARILMETAGAARSYTSEQLVPLMQPLMAERFLPQSVPSYAATENLARLRTRFPEFAYKEATLNPTNPRDRASDWEADVIQKLKDDPQSTEFIGERSTPSGPALYIARAIRINDGACLACHSTPSAAPAPMLARYGPDNGFGWQLHDVVGAQIVSVPADVPLERAHLLLRTFMLSLLAVACAGCMTPMPLSSRPSRSARPSGTPADATRSSTSTVLPGGTRSRLSAGSDAVDESGVSAALSAQRVPFT